MNSRSELSKAIQQETDGLKEREREREREKEQYRTHARILTSNTNDGVCIEISKNVSKDVISTCCNMKRNKFWLLFRIDFSHSSMLLS